MANLIEQEVWEEGIYQLEKTDRVIGGEDGISNLQAKQLANRTQYLKNRIAKVVTDIKPYLIPVGSIMLWGAEIPPEGWLELNGQSFNITENPELAALYPEGKLPDFRGRFPRGWAHGSAVDTDPARALLSYQNGMVEKHKHISGWGESLGANPNSYFGRTTKAGYYGSGRSDWDNVLYYTNDGTSWEGSSPNLDGLVGDETRPKNIAVMFIIKTDLASAAEGAAGPSNLIVSPGSIIDKIGAQIQLNATVLPESMAAHYPVSYRSTDEAVCTVTSAGIVKLVGAGSAGVVASLSTGLVSTIPVVSHRYLTSLSLAAIPVLFVGDEYQSVITTAPQNHTETLIYSSSNADVAVFSDNGLVVAISAGSCVLTVEGSLSGIKTQQTITIKAIVEVIPYLQIDNVLAEIKEKGAAAQKAARGNMGISDAAEEIMIDADPINGITKGTLVAVIKQLAERIKVLEG